MYDELSRRPNWATIPCFDETRGSMRPQKHIATEILAAVLQFISHPVAKEGR